MSFAVVILAAGESKRYGSPKQLADLNGELLLVSVIKKVLACAYEPYVALGANIGAISEHPSMLPFKHLTIPILQWSSGLSESIKESIYFLESKSVSGVVFLLGDQPLIDSVYFDRFLNKVEQFPTYLICTEYGERIGDIGVPAYFPSAYFEELKTLEGDQGAKKVLKNNKPIVLKCEGRLFDIDEPEDLAHAKLML